MKAISQPTVAARELRGYTGARFSPRSRSRGRARPARPSGQCAILRWFGCIFEILLLDIGDRMGITKLNTSDTARRVAPK